ncbi:MAG: EAL domain-containing protein, partial [bacterium]
MIEHDPAIARLGDWVLEQALSQGVSWLVRGLCGGLSVNIAALELRDPEFPDRLQSLFARHPRVAPARVRLEVLERAALADLSTVTRTMQTCRSIGVDFALDDFGTGYSSLSFLKRLPASTLKIDRSFVETMLE